MAIAIRSLVEKLWRDPVWSKVIASAIVGLFGIAYLLLPHVFPYNKPAPQVLLTLANSSAEQISIFRRGEFILWLPEGFGSSRQIPGRYDLEVPNGDSGISTLVVGPKASVEAVALLHSEAPIRNVLDSGAADLEFILRKERGGLLFSGALPFSEPKIEHTRWRVDLAKRE